MRLKLLELYMICNKFLHGKRAANFIGYAKPIALLLPFARTLTAHLPSHFRPQYAPSGPSRAIDVGQASNHVGLSPQGAYHANIP